MKISLSHFEDQASWEDFVSDHNYGYFLQSWGWGEFEQNGLDNKVERLGIYNESKLVGVAQCVVKPSHFGNYVYIPRGPVIDWNDKVLTKSVIIELEKYFRGKGFIFLRIDPNLEVDHPIIPLFTSYGFKDSVKTIQVERSWVVEIGGKTDEELFLWMRDHEMRKKVPNYIRSAVRKGVEIKIDNSPNGVEIFTTMIEQMGGRKGVTFHNANYFRNQMKHLGGILNLYIAYYEGEPVSTAIISIYGNEASYLHGASNSNVGNSNASYLLHWEAMKEAWKRGCTYYNFWGVVEDIDYHTGHPGYGYSYFKRSFGGYLKELMRAKEFPYSALKYSAFRLQEWYRLRKAKRLGVI